MNQSTFYLFNIKKKNNSNLQNKLEYLKKININFNKITIFNYL